MIEECVLRPFLRSHALSWREQESAVAYQAGKESAPTYISTLTSWLPNPSLEICDSCDNSLDVLSIISGRALS